METQRLFAVGLWAEWIHSGDEGDHDDDGDSDDDYGSSEKFWVLSFGVSPLLLGVTSEPVVARENPKHKVRWVDSTRRLEKKPVFRVHNQVTGENVLLVAPAPPPTTAAAASALPERGKVACGVNSRWFVSSGGHTDFQRGGLLGVTLASLSDPLPAATAVVVRLRHQCGEHRVRSFIFQRSHPNEIIAVVSKGTLLDDHLYSFVVIDAEGTFATKSLCMVSETICEVTEQLIVSAIALTKRDKTRCFITKMLSYETHTYKCMGFHERGDSGGCFILPAKYNLQVSSLSDSLFAISTAASEQLCGIWDCNDLSRGPIHSVHRQNNRVRSKRRPKLVAAEAGLLFLQQGGGGDDDDALVVVVEPFTQSVVLQATLPAADYHGVTSPCCIP